MFFVTKKILPSPEFSSSIFPFCCALLPWTNDYFFPAFEWIIKQGDFVVATTLIGTVLNGLSHLHGVHDKSLFVLGLIRGLGGNLNEKTKQIFAREVCFSF